MNLLSAKLKTDVYRKSTEKCGWVGNDTHHYFSDFISWESLTHYSLYTLCSKHFLHPLLFFIRIATPYTQIWFGSEALYQYFHTLIFVCTVSCSTRKSWDCSGLHALKICVGCQKQSFTRAPLLQATCAVYSDMKWYIDIYMCVSLCACVVMIKIIRK